MPRYEPGLLVMCFKIIAEELIRSSAILTTLLTIRLQEAFHQRRRPFVFLKWLSQPRSAKFHCSIKSSYNTKLTISCQAFF